MDIKEFLALSEGKWFSQRTSYHLNDGKTENSKADLAIELISEDDRDLLALCQNNKIELNGELKATKISWDNSVDWGKPKQQGSSRLVLIPDASDAKTGKLIGAIATPGKSPKVGRFAIGNDETLTLIIENEDSYFEERQWFASSNLRLRTTLYRNGNGVELTCFYSEIRKAQPKTD
jgi:phycoerythrin-associated linker protein